MKSVSLWTVICAVILVQSGSKNDSHFLPVESSQSQLSWLQIQSCKAIGKSTEFPKPSITVPAHAFRIGKSLVSPNHQI
jgi:hypothetical protein